MHYHPTSCLVRVGHLGYVEQVYALIGFPVFVINQVFKSLNPFGNLSLSIFAYFMEVADGTRPVNRGDFAGLFRPVGNTLPR